MDLKPATQSEMTFEQGEKPVKTIRDRFEESRKKHEESRKKHEESRWPWTVILKE